MQREQLSSTRILLAYVIAKLRAMHSVKESKVVHNAPAVQDEMTGVKVKPHMDDYIASKAMKEAAEDSYPHYVKKAVIALCNNYFADLMVRELTSCVRHSSQRDKEATQHRHNLVVDVENDEGIIQSRGRSGKIKVDVIRVKEEAPKEVCVPLWGNVVDEDAARHLQKKLSDPNWGP